MPELEKLIDASKRGALEHVRAILDDCPELINMRDELGATPLHHAAFGGHRQVAQLLVQRGADINAPDSQFGATPAGWAIEYLREMGGFLGIELTYFAYAIRRGDVEWTKRFLTRCASPNCNPWRGGCLFFAPSQPSVAPKCRVEGEIRLRS